MGWPLRKEHKWIQSILHGAVCGRHQVKKSEQQEHWWREYLSRNNMLAEHLLVDTPHGTKVYYKCQQQQSKYRSRGETVRIPAGKDLSYRPTSCTASSQL